MRARRLLSGTWPDLGADEATKPLVYLALAGPVIGTEGMTYTFYSTAGLPTATVPVTFTWRATGWPPVTHTVQGLTDTIGWSWDVPGRKAVTVSVINAYGTPLAATTSITVEPVTRVFYLPLVLQNRTE